MGCVFLPSEVIGRSLLAGGDGRRSGCCSLGCRLSVCLSSSQSRLEDFIVDSFTQSGLESLGFREVVGVFDASAYDTQDATGCLPLRCVYIAPASPPHPPPGIYRGKNKNL